MALPRKFRNVPVEVDGICFDSKKEAKRWGELRLLVRVGEITDLQRQVRFPMVVQGDAVCSYVADFTYRTRAGALVVEDVKSPPTRSQPAYRIKAKLLKALHGLQVVEV